MHWLSLCPVRGYRWSRDGAGPSRGRSRARYETARFAVSWPYSAGALESSGIKSPTVSAGPSCSRGPCGTSRESPFGRLGMPPARPARLGSWALQK